jgi:uncharacterized membrane protein YeaQ/YmgE (transglycosylase-associated protein family)
MTILAWIVLGAIAGWIASILMRTNREQGWLGNVIVGILGAVLGGWIMQAVGNDSANGFNLYSLLVSILGAVILLGIVNYFRRGTARGV